MLGLMHQQMLLQVRSGTAAKQQPRAEQLPAVQHGPASYRSLQGVSGQQQWLWRLMACAQLPAALQEQYWLEGPPATAYVSWVHNMRHLLLPQGAELLVLVLLWVPCMARGDAQP